MQSPFAWAFGWTSGQAGLGESKGCAMGDNSPSQAEEILLSQFLHGLISSRKGDRAGTTKVPGVIAVTNVLVSTHQA